MISSPYQQTAPAPDMRFWFFLLAFYAAWILRVIFLMPVGLAIDSVWLRQCWSHGLRILLWVIPVILYLKRTDGGHPAAHLLLNTLPRGRALARGSAVMIAFLALCAATALLFQGGSLHHLAAMTGSEYAGLFINMSIIAFAEELLFRGFIFQHFRARCSFHRANLTTAVLFLCIHLPGWLYMQGPNWGLLSLGGSVLVAGWVFGLIMEITRSLWPPILLHLLNNVLYGLLHG